MVNKYYKVNPLLNSLEYIFMLMTVLQCNSIYMYFTQSYISKAFINILWQIILILMIFVYLNKNYNIDYIKYFNLIIFIVTFLVIIGGLILYNFVIYPSFSKSYIVKLLFDPIMIVIYFFFMNNIYHIKKLFIDFENIIIWISCISLPLLLLYILHIPSTSIKFSKWGASQLEYGYFNLSYFANASTSEFLGMTWVRNSAMFTEPSMFAYVITIALLIEFFFRHNTKLFNYRITILLITVITTSSTTGIIISFLAYIYYMSINSDVKSYYKYLFIILVPVFIIILISILIEKLNTGMNDSSMRFDDIIAGLKAWKSHIFLGSGLGNNSIIKHNMSLWRFLYSIKPSESAGLPTILAQGGIIWGMFYILPSCLISRYSSRFLGLAVFPIILFIFVVSQGFYIYIILLCYFWYIIVNYNDKRELLNKILGS